MPKTNEELEKDIKRLEIRLETLIDFLNVPSYPFGPPNGREPYDRLAAKRIKEKGL